MVIVKGRRDQDRFQFQTEEERRCLYDAYKYFYKGDEDLDSFLRHGVGMDVYAETLVKEYLRNFLIHKLGMNVHDEALVKEFNAMGNGYREISSRGKEQRTISLNRWKKIEGYAELSRKGIKYIPEEQIPEEQPDTKPQRNINLLLTGLSQDKKNTI